MEITASSFKLRANSPEGQKAISYQIDSGEYVTIAPMITYILVPLGLPPEAGVAIILTIWPLFEWFLELQCAMACCANTAIAGNVPPGAPGCRAS